MKVAIVIPTYNELENVQRLIPRIEEVLKGSGLEGWLIFVDDSSPDGTAEAILAFQERYENIVLLSRPGKMGLGSAHILGFSHGRDILGADLFIQMDADLSHPPEAIPSLLKAVEGEYDIAVGSRYCEGGGIEGWGYFRKLVSGTANTYARLLLGLGVRDVTSGFKAYNLKAMDILLSLDLRCKGYTYQVESLYKLLKRGLSAGEVPITFIDRAMGKSKLGVGDILSYAWNVLKLRFG